MIIIKLYSEIKRLISAFGYSFSGLKAASTEAAFRLEVIVAVFAIPLSFILTTQSIERAMMVGSVFLVMIVELLNTAIEDAINRISYDIHPLSKRAKDVASAAVLLSIINAIFIWALILWN